MPNEPQRSTRTGDRLAGCEGRLRLLLAHLAGRAVRSRVELDDLLQEVYLRALAHPERLPEEEEGDVALRRYLTRIARHTVIDVARAIRAAKRSGGEERLERTAWSRVGLDPAAQTAGPATRVVAGESLGRLLSRFEALSAEHRRVIGLRQFEGLSARDTARRMGRSETAIHSLYRRALEAWDVEGT